MGVYSIIKLMFVAFICGVFVEMYTELNKLIMTRYNKYKISLKQNIFSKIIAIIASAGILGIIYLFQYSKKDIATTAILYFLIYIFVVGMIRMQFWKLKKRELLNVIVFYVISIAAILMLKTISNADLEDVVNGNYSVMALILIVCMDVLFFRILSGLLREKSQTEDYKQLEQKISGQEQYLKNVKQLDDQIRKLRHDMDKQLSNVSIMINSGLNDVACDYVKSYKGAVENISNYIDTDNAVVNAVLNSKIAAAKNENIIMDTRVHKYIKKMEDLDICSLLGNLLDNAVEAELKLPEEKRHIEFEIFWDEDDMVMRIRNNIEFSVLSENENLDTTKSDKDNHGLGTKIIQDVVKKYNGQYDVYEEYNMFCCEIRW